MHSFLLDGFDVYNLETSLPKIDWDAIENHLKSVREEERKVSQPPSPPHTCHTSQRPGCAQFSPLTAPCCVVVTCLRPGGWWASNQVASAASLHLSAVPRRQSAGPRCFTAVGASLSPLIST